MVVVWLLYNCDIVVVWKFATKYSSLPIICAGRWQPATHGPALLSIACVGQVLQAQRRLAAAGLRPPSLERTAAQSQAHRARTGAKLLGSSALLSQNWCDRS